MHSRDKIYEFSAGEREFGEEYSLRMFFGEENDQKCFRIERDVIIKFKIQEKMKESSRKKNARISTKVRPASM